MGTIEVELLQKILLGFALGALVGLEREQQEERKYAGLRTLSLLCGAGPVAISIAQRTGFYFVPATYVVLGAILSLLVFYVRMQFQDESEIGLTTSVSVFTVTLVGVLTGYGFYLESVAVTLIVVFLLSEKSSFAYYTKGLDDGDISDAIKVGILGFVLYPALPKGAVGPGEVLHLRKGLLFVILILIFQFIAYYVLKWGRSKMGFIAAACVGGFVSSLAVVTSMAEYVHNGVIERAGVTGSLTAVASMIVRNGVLAVLLTSPAFIEPLLVPLGAGIGISLLSALLLYRRSEDEVDTDFDAYSPLSFYSAIKFGIMFLVILVTSEVAKMYLAIGGVYGTAFIGGFASSTAVVASAATLISGGSITMYQGAIMIVTSITSSLVAKLIYTEMAGARFLTTRLLAPFIGIGGAMGLVFF